MNRPQNYGSISSPTVGFSGEQTSEFNSYCDNVVTNIYTVNSSLKTLDNALKNIGTQKDNQGLRNKIHVTQLSTNQIASATSKDIHRLKSIVAKGEKQKQLQVEKLEENFKDAINRYHTLQKELASKQKAHLLIPPSIESEVAQEDDYNQQQQQALAREMAFEQGMMLEREARIKQIEADVLDINQIMRELGSLVHEQGETIDTIENRIDHAAGSVEEGAEQLIKASRYQTRFRKKLLYSVLIGIVIVAIIIGVLVSQLKK
ncbi:syntaxin-12 [Anoplophora glabripennis]|uniref:syntaxin-12 n=1 Tax=Anoplophora glabripennis TaxID=217634 RepID=UPI000874B839|nr:syntaxin-12 [Anoplophora glabripennis]